MRIANPAERYHAYPFELSGGMCQRVVIALALACRPQLLIADEPTTGLDVTTQKTVMDLVTELTRERGMSTILITHDLGLAAAYCDRVMVMEKGDVVETASSKTIFKAPAHAYTRKLMRATPRVGATLRDLLPEERTAPALPAPAKAQWRGRAEAGNNEPLLLVENLVKEYPRKDERGRFRASCSSRKSEIEAAPPFRAVDGISFSIARGESVGLVGESGCGKSTTSTMLMRLIDASGGRILFDGEDIGAIPGAQFARLPQRRRIQMVFQDATDSLNPRFTAARAIADPILPARRPSAARKPCAPAARSWPRQVGLPLELLDRFPHQLSGGQKARVGIARAIASRPRPRHPRRTDRGAGCFGAGGRAQSVAGIEGDARHELSVRLARSECRAAALRPCHRDAERADRRGGADASRCCRRRSDDVYAANCWPRFRIRRCDGGEREAMSEPDDKTLNGVMRGGREAARPAAECGVGGLRYRAICG